MLLALHKPFGVLSQFTPDHPGQRTLAEFGLPPGVYPLGRLDRDSEGLLLLSDEPGLNNRLLDPRHRHPRTYWAQVEGEVTQDALRRLRDGVILDGRPTLPARAARLGETSSDIPRGADVASVTTRSASFPPPPRDPPIRQRKHIPTSWLEMELHEGRNRQVRRMTAAVGFPTLRLLRVRIGRFELPPDLAPGSWREVAAVERNAVLATATPQPRD